MQVQKSWLKMGRIERIFITHMHSDHTLGLVPFLGSLMSGIHTTNEDKDAMIRLGLSKKPKLHIYGPPGLRLMIRQLLNLTSMTLGDVYAVHELIPNDASTTGACFKSTSPHGNGNAPSCECNEEDLQAAEAIGKNIQADADGCWRDILHQAEGDDFRQSKQGQLWRVDAGPIRHRVMSLGFVVSEPPSYEPLDTENIFPILDQQAEALTAMNPSIRHPRQVLSIMTKTGKSFTMPDGQIIPAPKLSTAIPRKIVIFGDCSGTDNKAFMEMIHEPSLLVHECTNAYIDPEYEEAGRKCETQGHDGLAGYQGPAEYEELARAGKEKTQIRAFSRGHTDAETVGKFAKSIAAQRVVVNHFSAR